MPSATNIQEILVERCKLGDRKAQYELYKRYSKAMLNVAMRITNDYMEAEDVLQEAFVRAFKSLASFKGDATFGAWLKRIVINTSINHLKKRRAEFVTIEEERLEIPEETHESVGPDWDIEVVRKAISQLPEGYRLVLSLYLIEGYDHKEIGHILEISEATSKSQFSRAKRKLRHILGEQMARDAYPCRSFQHTTFYLKRNKLMQDQLEKFILSQKDQLDVFEPDDRLWERIDRELNNAPVRQLNLWSQSWKVAAAVAMLMAASALLWWVSKQSPPGPIAADTPETATSPQAFYTAELVEVESYYATQISAQKARIESFRTEGIVLDQALYEQMDLLNNAYQELQLELPQTEDEELIVNAMIQNLMMQMQLLNQQLMILEEIKNKQAQYGKQKQS